MPVESTQQLGLGIAAVRCALENYAKGSRKVQEKADTLEHRDVDGALNLWRENRSRR
jgi:hypothetical protein